MSSRLSRRWVITRGLVGGVGLAIAGRAGARMGGGGDPPPGPAFRDPPVLPDSSTVPGIVEVSVEARPELLTVAGAPATLLTYEGQFIAPTLRARRGDLVRMHFHNSLPEDGTNLLGHVRGATNVHVHGWHVSPTGIADNVHIRVERNQPFDYEYDLSTQEPGTLGLYHPHIHGTVAEQMWAGMVGALDVADEVAALSAYETHLLLLKDLTVAGGEPAPHAMMRDYMHGLEGNWALVNGDLNPVLSMRPGQVQRWRFINVSNARFYRLGLEGHSLALVGTDGGLLDRPYVVPELLVSPGERVDVLVQVPRRGTYRLFALPYARMGMMASPRITLMTVSVAGAEAGDALPRVVNPDAHRIPVDYQASARFTLSMGQGRGYINGISFGEKSFVHMSRLGDVELWEIVNESGMDHPWHQHVNACQLVSASGGDSVYAAYARLYAQTPAWKDVVIVPKWGSVRMLVPVMDFPGMTMFHCHIVEHEDIGMMAMWHIMDGSMPM